MVKRYGPPINPLTAESAEILRRGRSDSRVQMGPSGVMSVGMV